MGKKIFIGNLPWKAREQDLEDLLVDRGLAYDRVEVVMDRDDPGRSRGFAFAHFATDSDAERALTELAGAELMGRSLRVDLSVERSGGNGGGRGGRGGRGGSRGGDRGGRRDDDLY